MFYSKTELEEIANEQWHKKAYADFDKLLKNPEKPFPCLFGVTGHQKGMLRFAFYEELTGQALKDDLINYCKNYKNYGRHTSLVVFEKPSPLKSLNDYKEKFWGILQQLRLLDPKPWPENLPTNVDDPLWEFCFYGEPMFIVCSTPAHQQRLSRYNPTFMLTIQPRWVFEELLGTKEKATNAFSVVRERLRPFDKIDIAPVLGMYGLETNKEWQQYFLEDNNINLPNCPHHIMPQEKQATFSKIPLVANNIYDILHKMLPQQGSIELQTDAPKKLHDWHMHENDETLVIIDGELNFFTEKEAINCKPGDIIHLPARTKHKSEASQLGCIYAIAEEFVSFGNNQ